MNNYGTRIVFFDGICNLCNLSVDFLIRKDTKNIFKFAPLQGETALNFLPKNIQEQLDSVVFYKDGRVYSHSDAAIQILIELGGLYSLARIFLIFPRFFRNAIYSAIAKRRYKWFGKKETCRLPTVEEQARFLA